MAQLRTLHLHREFILIGIAAFLISSTALLGACNTTEGFGRDIKSAGQGIENAASDAKK